MAKIPEKSEIASFLSFLVIATICLIPSIYVFQHTKYDGFINMKIISLFAGLVLTLVIIAVSVTAIADMFESAFEFEMILRILIAAILLIATFPFFILGYVYEYIQLAFNVGRRKTESTDNWLDKD